MRPSGLPADLARMKLLVDTLIVFVVMLLAAGAIARSEPAAPSEPPVATMHQELPDATLALIVTLLDW
jgi:hypothetical protein